MLKQAASNYLDSGSAHRMPRKQAASNCPESGLARQMLPTEERFQQREPF